MLILQHTARIRGAALLCCLLNASVWAACEGWYHSPGWCTDPKTGLMYQEGSAPPVSQSPEERAAAQRRAEAAEYQRWLKQESQIIGKDSWGVVALAVLDKDGKVATNAVTGWRSREKTEQKALEVCKKSGGLDCRLLVTFKNTCVAIASTGWAHQGATPVAIARAGATKREAYNNAMRTCQALMDWDGSGHSCTLWGNVACSGWGWNDSNNHTPDLDQERLPVPPELAHIPLPEPDVDYEGYPNASPRGLAISTNGAVTQ